MNILTKFTKLVIPAAIGLGVAWVGVRIMKNEMKLEERKTELEIQLGAKSLQSF